MNRHHSTLTTLFFLVVVYTGFSQDKYQPGHYVDYSDSIHHGLIHRFLQRGQNKIHFKETEKSDRLKLGIDEMKKFVINEDTFEIQNVKSWERQKILSFSKSDSVGDFVKVLERGKIELFAHYYIVYGTSSGWNPDFPGASIPTKSKAVDFIVSKDSLFARVRNTDAGAKLPSGFYGVRKLIADDSVLVKRFDNKDFKLGDLRKLVATYNARAANMAIKGDVVLFRRSGKGLPKEVGIQYLDSLVGNLTSTSLIELEVDKITDFSLCVKGFGCTELSGTSGETNYLELVYDKKERKQRIVFANDEEGKYYHQRISFLMEKAKNKKK